MHPSPAFQADEAAARDIIAAHPLATLVVNGAKGPVVALAPLLWREDGRTLYGHLARSNAFWRCAEDGPVEAAAVFRGADAYVSPSAYPSKAAHGKAARTWNYVAAEARGLLSLETGADAMARYVGPLSEAMEAGRPSPWAVSDAPEDDIAALMAGIVGFEIAVSQLRAVRKLSQTKSQADRAGVAADLAARGHATLAAEMKQERV